MRQPDLKHKPIILFVCNYYLPGYKAGGGLRTIVHTVERFKDKFDFRIVTFGHDGDGIPYNTVKINEWNDVKGAQVFYLSANKNQISKLHKLISEVRPDLIYLNSVFSTLTISLLVLRKLSSIAKIPVVLAPEGELSVGALQLKAEKKKVFSRIAKKFRLYENLIWKVTAEPEKSETEAFKGKGGSVFIAPNMPSKSIFEDYRQELKPKKKSGQAKMIFLSRYARKKNFKWLIDNLGDIAGELQLDVIGPIEDSIYWEETQSAIQNLPTNVKVTYKGEIQHEKVLETVFNYHFFVLPTLGENFGHVFVEAMAAGCPLIISDRTPWINLKDKEIGWDLPLEDPQTWNDILNYCIGLDQDSYSELSTAARTFACRWLTDPKIEEDTLKVLNHGLNQNIS